MDIDAASTLSGNLMPNFYYQTAKAVRPSAALSNLPLSPAIMALIGVRVAGCFLSHAVMQQFQLPPFVFAFYIHVFAGACFLFGGRTPSWSPALKRKMLLIFFHAGLQTISFVLWATALLLLHPLQAVVAEYVEHFFCSAADQKSGVLPPIRVVVKVGLALCFLATTHAFYDSASSPEEPTWFFGAYRFDGAALLLVYSGVEVGRKAYKSWLAKSVGTANVTVISTVLCGPMLLPFVVLYSGFAPHAWSALQSWQHLASLFVAAVMIIIAPAGILSKASDDMSARMTTGRRQCACAAAMGYSLSLAYASSSGLGSGLFSAGYTISLILGIGMMLWALGENFALRARPATPSIVDPFADYELPAFEEIDGSLLDSVMKSQTSKKLLVFFLMNVFYTAIEFLYGVYSGSLGLVSDSFHMLLDSLSVAIALYAAFIATWPKNGEYTYGYGRYEVLSGFTNGVLLLCIAAFIFSEALGRILDPPEIEGSWLLSVSVGGLCINLAGVVFFHEAHHVGIGSDKSCGGHSHAPDASACQSHAQPGHSHGHSHSHSHGGKGGPKPAPKSNPNMRGVYLHILADLLGSIGVIVSSCIVSFTGFSIADPICSMAISLLIIVSALPLIQETGTILMQSLPESQADELGSCLQRAARVPGVAAVESHAFWQFTPGSTFGSLRVAAGAEARDSDVLAGIRSSFAPLVKPPGLTVEINKSMSPRY